MSSPHLVVVGAGLAGLRAVEASRRGGFDGKVTLIGAEPHPPYDRPPLSKRFITGVADPTVLRGEASLCTDLDVDVRLGVSATELRPAARAVIAGGETIRFTGLVIATGAAPRQMTHMPRLSGVHTLRTLEDAHAIRQELLPGSRVVIIGAGFIGSEMAFSALHRGGDVTMVEAAPVPLVRAVGDVMGAALGRKIKRSGARILCGTVVSGIEGNSHVETVRLADGSALPADVVVIGVGAAPATAWLEGSGLTLDDGVVCDETLNAGPPGVYAAGDVARWFNALFGEFMRLEHWTTAAEQGALAARNAINPDEADSCSTVPYFWSDWNDDRIQFVGVPGVDEIRLVRGDTDDGDFLVLYRRGDRLAGALGLNQARPVMRLRAMIAKQVSWCEAIEFARGEET